MANSSKKRALVTGCTGQDGSYLCELLLEKGYEVHGLIRRSSAPVEFARSRLEKIRHRIHYHYGDMTDPFSLLWVLKEVEPDEVYNLAAQTHVLVSWETPWYTAQTTGIGVLNLLEAIRVLELDPKIFQASTSELYSGLEVGKQNEKTKFDPVSPYGTAKLYGFQIAKNYRDAFGMFICNGIMFNHESARRGDNFVTKKIINAANSGVAVQLGNIYAHRDWGYAPEYMEAAWKMLQQDEPDDYVIATGETASVQDFVGWVSKVVGHEVKIVENEEFYRPVDVPKLQGDASKAKEKLGFEAKIKGPDLVKKMIYET